MKDDKKKRKFGKGTKRNWKRDREERESVFNSKGPEVRDANNPINDPKWYAVNERIAKAVGSIPYNIFPGERIDLKPSAGVTDKSVKGVPGVLQVKYTSIPGVSTDGSSAVNIAAKAIYSWVRHQNSGHSNYEASDLMMYILGLDEVYTRYFECKRIYELAMTYDYVNRNIPDLILQTLGVDAANVRANLAQFRAGLNIVAAKISSLAVPNRYHLFKRHALLAQTIFMDSSSMRGQFYVWNQNNTHKYNPAHTGGGALEAKALSANRTYTTLLAEIEDILQPILEDDDMNIMSGDILKAYGRENLYVLPDVDEAATAQFVYDENMLAQIENSTCESVSTIASLDIYQSSNTIMCAPTFNNSNVIHAIPFNSHKDEPDHNDTLEWSRGITLNGKCGTEVITGYSMYLRGYDASDNATVFSYVFSTFVDMAGTNYNQIMINMPKFDWHPMVIPVHKTGGVIDEIYGFTNEIKKFTILEDSEVGRLHDSAIMGELNALLLAENTTR